MPDYPGLYVVPPTAIKRFTRCGHDSQSFGWSDNHRRVPLAYRRAHVKEPRAVEKRCRDKKEYVVFPPR